MTWALILALSLSLLVQHSQCITDCSGVCSVDGNSNSYHAGVGNAPAGTTLITIAKSSTVPISGSRIMIIQMQGGELVRVDSTSTTGEDFGRITDYGNLGTYEFNFIIALTTTGETGNTIIELKLPLTKTFISDSQSTFQVIETVYCPTVEITKSFTCTPWDGEKGGVFVIEAQNLQVAESVVVDCSGAGFRGGQYLPECFDLAADTNLGCGAPHGGAKGESCVNNIDFPACRGAFTTGGGGAVCVDSLGNTDSLGGAGGSYAGKLPLILPILSHPFKSPHSPHSLTDYLFKVLAEADLCYYFHP